MRWPLALSWTAFVLFLMLAPGDNRQVDGLSKSAGGSDLTDALGHVVIFFILTVLWQWALSGRSPSRHALLGAALVAFGLGVGTEVAQTFVAGRGASWLDFSANGLGVLAAIGWRRARQPS
jgi:VanZ family protein